MPYLLLALAALFWSGNFVLGRAFHAELPPVGLAFWRWAAALAILAPLALPRLRRAWPALRAARGRIAALALLGVAGFNTFVYLGLQSTTTVNALLINATVPVLIVPLAWLSGIERPGPRPLAGALVSLAGVAWIMARGDPAALARLDVHAGDAWILLAAFCWAAYSLLLRRLPPGLDPLAFLLAIVALGVAVLAPLYLAEHLGGRAFPLTRASAAVVGYVALFASVLAFVCWNHGIRAVGAARGGLFMHLMPVFGTVLAVLFLHERLHRYHLLGMLGVAAGIALATSRPRGRRKEEQAP
ncbi:DMT family transporter [Inmirania thermothiophila]|uniref:Drug/metabolite transporter (DMT)-like permease n=1 Tax=Inmirania thermothiophila TaxID=1750597 RepID=A0A3N1Y471_9GAMM|nr:DMT family transporter [Inmirania thermothiophila]ROR32412.1 drug/metabolite transporter (DMT)-like permease [Inmirania thermothiophila]